MSLDTMTFPLPEAYEPSVDSPRVQRRLLRIAAETFLYSPVDADMDLRGREVRIFLHPDGLNATASLVPLPETAPPESNPDRGPTYFGD